MKGDRDPATEVDYAIEQQTRDFLLDAGPGIGFLGEEGGQSGGDNSLMWALDRTVNSDSTIAVSLQLADELLRLLRIA